MGAPLCTLWNTRSFGPDDLTSLYSLIALPPAKPGELIRAVPFDEYDLPFEVSAVRILYHSRSARGEDVAVSGVVLIPDGVPPAGGWPVIAWAHAFSGVARRSAPSLMKNSRSGPFLSMYANLGFAVVATDYAGLGTGYRNAFVDIQSNAMDVIYSVLAARATVPQLSPKWLAMGDSDGGLAALGVAEAESEIRDPNYLGSVAISGVADLKDIYEHFAHGPSQEMLAVLAYGIKTLYPQFKVDDVLTEKVLPLYQQLQNSCTAERTSSEMAAGEMLKPDWENDKFVQQFFSRNTLGQKRAYAPLLVISGESDPTVLTTMTAHVVADMCKQGDRMQFYTYPGLDSGGVIGGSVTDQIAWIRARFGGRAAPSNCH
jgi:alpha-beta hydrolase superfamily lysophospholipase